MKMKLKENRMRIQRRITRGRGEKAERNVWI
jgi:hypothetical protein